jgi:elongation factor 3
MEQVKELSEQKKKPGAREGAVAIISAIADKCYDAAQPFLIAALPLVLELCSDKMKFVGELAKTVVKKVIENINQFMAPTVVPMLMEQMGNEQKWQTHVAALQGLGYMMLAAGEQVVVLMHIIVPKVAAMMWEMKQEVKDAATQCLQDVCGCIDNRDIEPFVPALISCINHPEEVPECIHLLAATTFVQTVDSAALSIVVPLITRAFTEKSTAIIRLTAVIVENMSKLVDEPSDAECFLGKVYDEVKSGAETMSNPEARSVLVRGLQNLDTIKNKMAANPRKMITIEGFTDDITKACGSVKGEGKAALDFVIATSVSMANSRRFADEDWNKAYAVLNGFGDKAKISAAAAAMKDSCESAVEPEAIIDEDEDVEDL